jgi:hypothetical protein
VAPGPDTLEAMIDGRVTTRPVDVPEGPASLRDVDLGAGVTAPLVHCSCVLSLAWFPEGRAHAPKERQRREGLREQRGARLEDPAMRDHVVRVA